MCKETNKQTNLDTCTSMLEEHRYAFYMEQTAVEPHSKGFGRRGRTEKQMTVAVSSKTRVFVNAHHLHPSRVNREGPSWFDWGFWQFARRHSGQNVLRCRL